MPTLNDLRKSLSQNSGIKNTFESPEYARSRVVFKKRMELGLSQMELAEKAQVTQKTISRIEGADEGIRESTIRKVHLALGISEDDTPTAKRYVLHR
ncbi:helix-turn-helix domain-containing protein [Planococcus lenghuensis]|uniref:HTH cro/C1-type domain-containing protein n=1 Tax=Planococcus lenghuensis TaxID=2213202 RepID=A0A1Q2L681_9BACL|nr:helix-turn-helix domain-containing protein [Planococcus lenghuensis]AQQ55597.1 hypothetical protein B0X71_20710 [Planococcus lenghuensis]